MTQINYPPPRAMRHAHLNHVWELHSVTCKDEIREPSMILPPPRHVLWNRIPKRRGTMPLGTNKHRALTQLTPPFGQAGVGKSFYQPLCGSWDQGPPPVARI